MATMQSDVGLDCSGWIAQIARKKVEYMKKKNKSESNASSKGMVPMLPVGQRAPGSFVLFLGSRGLMATVYLCIHSLFFLCC